LKGKKPTPMQRKDDAVYTIYKVRREGKRKEKKREENDRNNIK
jgi:hypothetical protein